MSLATNYQMAARRDNVISIMLLQVISSDFLISSATSQSSSNQVVLTMLMDPVPDLIDF